MRYENILNTIENVDLTPEQKINLLEAVKQDSDTFNDDLKKKEELEQNEKLKNIKSVYEIAMETRLIK